MLPTAGDGSSVTLVSRAVADDSSNKAEAGSCSTTAVGSAVSSGPMSTALGTEIGSDDHKFLDGNKIPLPLLSFPAVVF